MCSIFDTIFAETQDLLTHLAGIHVNCTQFWNKKYLVNKLVINIIWLTFIELREWYQHMVLLTALKIVTTMISPYYQID